MINVLISISSINTFLRASSLMRSHYIIEYTSPCRCILKVLQLDLLQLMRTQTNE